MKNFTLTIWVSLILSLTLLTAKPLTAQIISVTTSGSCINNPVLLNATVSNPATGTHYHWDFGDGGTQDITFPASPNTSHTYPAVGFYNSQFTVTYLSGSSFTSQQMVTVNPQPVANFHTSGGCVNNAVQFIDASYANTAGNIQKWVWDFGDGSPTLTVNFPNNPDVSHVYANPGTYTATLTVENSYLCSGSTTKTISIQPGVVIGFTYSQPACSMPPVQFTGIAVPGSGAIASWQWEFGDGSTSSMANPMHIYYPGTYVVTLNVMDTNGCYSTASQNVVVSPQPLANFSYDISYTDNPVPFYDLSQSGTGSIVSWFWDFGDPASGSNDLSVLQNPQHIYSESGTYVVTLTCINSSGCSNTYSKNVTINPQPIADFSSTGGCANSEVLFTDLSTVASGNIIQWVWDLGDGSSNVTVNYPDNPNVSHVYAVAGNYNVTLTVSSNNQCSASKIKQVTIQPMGGISFSFSSSCQGFPVQFTGVALPGTGTITSWLWNFGDPASGVNNTSTLQNPTHIYITPGNYIVTLTAATAGGCTYVVSMSLQVNQLPVAAFIHTDPQLNQAVLFTDQSVPGSAPLISWNWDFGDSNTSNLQNPTHAYSIPGNYLVSLTVTDANGCSGLVVFSLTVPAGTSGVTINGRVYAGNDIISQATVRLIKIDDAGFPVSTLKAAPGASGYFVFDNVPQGKYFLLSVPFSNSTYGSLFMPTFYISSMFWQSAALIELGDPQNPYDTHLLPYGNINGDYTINGQLLNGGKSMGLTDQEVVLLDENNLPVAWAFTDENGNFSFTSLPEGTYYVNPVVCGYTTYPFTIMLNANNSPAFVQFTVTGQIITGLENYSLPEQLLNIYPNPATSIFNIVLDNTVKWFSVQVYNTNGALVQFENQHQGNTCIVKLDNLTDGIYLVKIVDNKGVNYTERVVKN